jgi:uncharacterized membrane protein YgcG
MGGAFFHKIIIMAAGLWAVLLPSITGAQPVMPGMEPPPIGPALIREGDFAVMLLNALDMGQVNDEIEAESRLGDAGIAPRNGWIADYPTTPDIVGELQASAADAAASRRIRLDRDEAARRVAYVAEEAGLMAASYGAGVGPDAVYSPTAQETADYYYDEGPPIYTYYAPPADYSYLYVFVPYPFRSRGFRFPGFYVLNDFHRVFIVDGRVAHCSNHFNDRRVYRAFRIDPAARFRGSTYAGIGAFRSARFINTGVSRSERTIFNAPRPRTASGAGSPSARARTGAAAYPNQSLSAGVSGGGFQGGGPGGGFSGGGGRGGGGGGRR